MDPSATTAAIVVRRRLLAHVGSLRTALALMGLLALVALLRPDAPSLAVVFAALGANLLAALVVHPLLRRRLPLLVFHVALLALVLLAGAGRVLSEEGRFELLQGVPFDGTLLREPGDTLAVPALAAIGLHNEGFTIDYAPGRRRGATRNTVSWAAPDGAPQRAVIGDHRPLQVAGWRLYTSPNKGFAPVLRWLPADGSAPVAGAVHLPSFPMHELRQSSEWALPDGRSVWLMLHIDEPLIAPDAADTFRVPQRHRVVLRQGDERMELAPGQAWRLDGGTLVYEGLRTWMGYRASRDPTLAWLLAAALAAAFALAAHYAGLAWPRAAERDAATPKGAAADARAGASVHASSGASLSAAPAPARSAGAGRG